MAESKVRHKSRPPLDIQPTKASFEVNNDSHALQCKVTLIKIVKFRTRWDILNLFLYCGFTIGYVHTWEAIILGMNWWSMHLVFPLQGGFYTYVLGHQRKAYQALPIIYFLTFRSSLKQIKIRVLRWWRHSINQKHDIGYFSVCPQKHWKLW